jgi:hypothetical protein
MGTQLWKAWDAGWQESSGGSDAEKLNDGIGDVNEGDELQ